MNRVKQFKKLVIFLLVCTLAVGLSACGKAKVPLDGISDATYLKADGNNITVTNRELYEQFRFQGASILATMIDEMVLATEINSAKALVDSETDTEWSEYLDEQVNSAIHSTSDLEALEELYLDSPERFNRNVEQFVDSLYLVDNNIDTAKLLADILNRSGDTKPYENYKEITDALGKHILRDQYILTVAQKIFAKGKLEEEVVDEDSDYYIEDADVVSYYKSNHQGRYDVEVFYVRFINLNEANAALQKFFLKSDSKGQWYEVPNITLTDDSEPGTKFVDLDEINGDYAHVINYLKDLGVYDKLLVGDSDIVSNGGKYDDALLGKHMKRDLLSTSDISDYYNTYTISTTRTVGLPDEPLKPNSEFDAGDVLVRKGIKQYFVDIYNLLNQADPVKVTNDGKIVAVNAGSDFTTTKTYDELTDVNTTLRGHIYNTLLAETKFDPESEKYDEEAVGYPYSGRVQTAGSSRYLVYKFDDNSWEDEDILITINEDTDDEEDVFNFDTEDEALKTRVQEAYDKAYEELFDSKLTSSYISSKITEKYEDIDINIYDKTVRLFYEQSHTYEGTTKTKSGNVLVDLGDAGKISPLDLFNKMEPNYGVNIALDLATTKWLVSDKSGYTVDSDERKDYESDFKDLMTAFTSDEYSSSGYPASIGREAFLLLAFNANNNEEAINNLYIHPDLRNQLYEDLERLYGEDVYDNLADLAKLQYTNFRSITVSHLLIYFDPDNDGSPDDPQKYLESLGEEGGVEQTAVYEKLINLVRKIMEDVGKYTGHATGLSNIATTFQDTGRIIRGSFTEPIDIQNELYWSEFRSYGFNLKYESISSAITNTSNFITGSSVLDQVFYDRATDLHELLYPLLYDEDGKALETDTDSVLPYLDGHNMVWSTDTPEKLATSMEQLDTVRSSFGWHFILATAVGTTTSAIYEEADDEDGIYVSEDDETLNAYNEDSETLTSGQIKYYLIENAKDEGALLPTVVNTAITNYLTPVYTKLTNTYSQRDILFRLLNGVGLNWTDSNCAVRFEKIWSINTSQFYEYMNSTIGINDTEYMKLYGSWFTTLFANEGNIG